MCCIWFLVSLKENLKLGLQINKNLLDHNLITVKIKNLNNKRKETSNRENRSQLLGAADRECPADIN